MVKKINIIYLILFCLLFVFESGKAFGNAADELKQADTYCKNGNYSQAEKSYQNIVTNYPNTDYALNAQVGLAKLHLRRGDKASADSVIKKLLSDFSDHSALPRVINEIACQCRNFKMYSKAIELYKYSLSRWPGGEYDLESQKLIAKASIEAGDLVAADRAVAKLFSDYSSSPGLAEAIEELAHKYRSSEIKRYDKVIELYQHIIVQWPNSEDALAAQKLIATANIEAGDMAAADRAVAKLFSDYSSNPGLAEAIYEIGRKYRSSEIKRYSKAIELYKHSLGRWPNGEYALESQKLIAKTSIEAGDLAAADKAVAKLLSDYLLNPGLAEAIEELARKYRSSEIKRYDKADELERKYRSSESKRYDKAIEHYQHIIAQCPNSEDALAAQTLIAKACFEAGDLAAADRAVAKLLSDYSSNHGLAKAIDEIAYEYRSSKVKRHSTAIELYKYSLSRWPNGEYALKSQKLVAKASIEAGDLVAADKAVAKLLSDYSLNPGLAEAIDELARKYHSREIKRYDKAIELYQHIIVQCPNSKYAFAALKFIAKLNLERGDATGADTAIEKLKTDYVNHSRLAESILEFAITACSRTVGRYSKAIELFQYICDTWPGSPYALRANNGLMWAQSDLIKSYIAADDDKNAQTVIKKLSNDFSTHPDLPKVVRNIATGYCDKGKYDKAVGLYLYFFETSPEIRGKYTDSEELVRPLCDIADRYFDRKEYDNANGLNEYIVSKFPKNTYALRAQKNLVKSYITTGDEAKADTAAKKLSTDFINFPGQWPAIKRVVGIYRDQAKYDKAIGLCQYLSETYPEDTDKINWRKTLAILNIDMGKDDQVQKMLEQILTDFNDSPQLPKAVFDIGEEYYKKALKSGNTVAKNYFTNALIVWKKIIDGMQASANRLATVHFVSAACYEKLGDYAKAAEHYEKVVETRRDHDFAWKAQFMVGRCYEKLGKTGDISKLRANSKTTTAYRELLEKYPDCKAANAARIWLSK